MKLLQEKEGRRQAEVAEARAGGRYLEEIRRSIERDKEARKAKFTYGGAEP